MVSFWPNFKSPNVGKMAENQVFPLKNIYGFKFKTFCYCLVVIYCFETALKNLEKVRLKTGSPFHTFTA